MMFWDDACNDDCLLFIESEISHRFVSFEIWDQPFLHHENRVTILVMKASLSQETHGTIP